jgi:hypothetical protein
MLATVGALATHLVALPFTVALGGVLFLWLCARLVGARGERKREALRLGAFVLGGTAALALGLSWTLLRPKFDSVMTGPYQFGKEVFLRHVIVQCGPGFAAAQRPWGLVDRLAGVYVALALLGLGALLWRRRAAAAALLVLPPATMLVGLYLQLGEKSVWPWFRYATPTIVPFLALVAAGICVRGRVLALALLAVLLSTHQHRASGLRAWAAGARVQRGAGYRAAADQIASDDYVGTIFAPNPSVFGDESDRLTSSYAIFRHDDLPAYFAPWYKPLTRIEYRRVVGRSPVPVRTDVEVKTLPPGKYAVFLGWDSYRGCKFLHPTLIDPSPPVDSGVFIPCIQP